VTSLRRPVDGTRVIPASRTSALSAARTMRADPLAHLGAVLAECGEIGRFALGPQRIVVVNSPGLAREVLVERHREFGKGRYQLRALRPLLGDGLLTSEGGLHDAERRAIAPLFHNRRIRRWAELVVDRTSAWTATIGDQMHEQDVLRAMYALSMLIIGEVLLSEQISHAELLGQAVTTAFEWEMYALTRPVPLPLWVPTSRSRRTKKALTLIRRHITEVADARREKPRAEWPDDVLSDLLMIQRDIGPLSDKLVHDELLTLFGASQETLADTLAWALYLVATHPDVMARMRREIAAVLDDRPVAFEDLAALPFSLHVIRETLRIYPPAAVVLRSATVDATLGGALIRRGTIVMVCPYFLHRNPELFPEPEQFDPDRFTSHTLGGHDTYAYLPFGAGPRACIGASLTHMMAQLVLVTIVRSVELRYAGEKPPRPELVINLRPQGGLPMQLQRR